MRLCHIPSLYIHQFNLTPMNSCASQHLCRYYHHDENFRLYNGRYHARGTFSRSPMLALVNLGRYQKYQYSQHQLLGMGRFCNNCRRSPSNPIPRTLSPIRSRPFPLAARSHICDHFDQHLHHDLLQRHAMARNQGHLPYAHRSPNPQHDIHGFLPHSRRAVEERPQGHSCAMRIGVRGA